jgi:hypothetical protein
LGYLALPERDIGVNRRRKITKDTTTGKFSRNENMNLHNKRVYGVFRQI